MTHLTHTPRQGVWRWYDDNATDASKTGLAAENTKYQLAPTYMTKTVMRLRVQIVEIGGAAGAGTETIGVQYSEDGTNWHNLGNNPVTSGEEGVWPNFANGSNTEGNTIGSQLLTGTTASGKYIESTGQTVSVGTNATYEIDIAMVMNYPPPDITTLHFRLVYAGVTLALNTGATEIQLQTSTPANRGSELTIDDFPYISAGGGRPNDFEPATVDRFHYDSVNSNWWFFTGHPNDTSNLWYYRWAGPGNDWSSRSTISTTANPSARNNAIASKTISGTTAIFVLMRAGSTTMRYLRGEMGASSITWDAVGNFTDGGGAAGEFDDHFNVSYDDGGYIWVGGIDNVNGTVWARRSTNADAGSSWTSGFNARRTLADAGINTATQWFKIIGLESDKAICIWYAAGDTDLRWATVTDAGGFSSATDVGSVVHSDDWSAARDYDNGLVYVAWAVGTADDGARRLSVFDQSDDTMAACTNPGEGGAGDTGSADGLPLAIAGGQVFLGGVYQDSGGGQFRTFEVKEYTPGSPNPESGSWGSRTKISPSSANYGNLDYSNSSAGAGGGVVVFGSMHGDDTRTFTSFSLEFYPVTVSSPPIGQAAAGSITPTGALSKSVSKLTAGSLTPTGTPARTTTKSFTGSITPTGALSAIKSVQQAVAGSLTPTGALIAKAMKSLSGSITPSGTISRLTNKQAAGSVTPTGATSKHTFKSFAGSITPSGVVSAVKAVQQAVAGALAPVGTLSIKTLKALSGSLTPTGALTTARIYTRALSGSITPAGTLAKKTLKSLSGSLIPTGALTAVKAVQQAVSGVLTPTGALVIKTLKQAAGTITPTGVISRKTLKQVIGSLSPSGVLNAVKVGVIQQAVSGVLTPAGTLIIKTLKQVSGTITPSGTANKSTTKSFVGTLTPAGSAAKKTLKQVAGALSSSGIMASLIVKAQAVAGTLTPTGALSVRIMKSIGGTIAPTGTVNKVISKAFSGVLNMAGSLSSIFGGAVTIANIDIEDSKAHSIAQTQAAPYALSVELATTYSLAITDAKLYAVSVEESVSEQSEITLVHGELS